MDIQALVAAVRAVGVTLQPEGALIRATGFAALPGELRAALRQHRNLVHTWLCAEAAAVPDEADALARAELRDTTPRPGAGYRPGDEDRLRDGLLTGFALHHRPAAPRAAPARDDPAREGY